jgi:hypothetical protein
MNLLNASSVVPECAHQRYHIVSMEWFKRWEAYVNSEEGAKDPDKINQKYDL